jgi:glucans biosynthesis protein
MPAPGAAQPPPRPFSFARVEHLAALRAKEPYAVRSSVLPGALRRLTYAQYRSIRFKPQEALWRHGSMFDVQFYHRGFAFTHEVHIYTVSPAGVREVHYQPSMFEFPPALARLRLAQNLGFAGVSVHYPLNSPNHRTAVIAFLGGTYFRVLGRNQVPGVTARGLTIDTAAVRGEEFPYFTGNCSRPNASAPLNGGLTP